MRRTASVIGSSVWWPKCGAGPDGGRSRARSWTRSTRRRRSSGSVAGRTPWPRLKTWPGRPAASVEDPAAPARRRRRTGRGGATGRGCPGRRGPADAARQPSASAIRQSRPMTSPPASAMQLAAARRCRCRSGSPGRRGRRARSNSRRMCGCDRPLVVERAEARRPTSRRAGRPAAPAATWARRYATVISTSAAMSACQRRRVARSMSALVAGDVARRPALDEVARERERRAGEADERRPASSRRDEPDRLEQRTDGRPRARTGAARRRPRPFGSARSMTGPTPSTISKADPDARERRHDVGEQDGRVDAEPADRLEGDLGAQRRGRWRSRGASPARGAPGTRAATRPAWRMNQTGVASTGSRRQARRKRSFMRHSGTPRRAARERRLDLGRPVGHREEPGLELRGRQEDRPGRASRRRTGRTPSRSEASASAASIGGVGRKKTRQQRADPRDRDLAARPPAAAARSPPASARRRVLEREVALGRRARRGWRSRPPSTADGRTACPPGRPGRRARRGPSGRPGRRTPRSASRRR